MLKTLLLDIETAPNIVHCWGLREQDISLNQIIESSYVLCWSAKWLGESEVFFERTPNPIRGSTRQMIRKIHILLDEADCVMHYNGTKFDIPTLNKEFLLHNMNPPSPVKELDLLKVVRQRFRFPSNKLDYVAQRLGIGKKIEHEGHMLWVRCMENDSGAWKRMEQYNKNDVVLLEKVFHKLQPWMKPAINRNLINDDEALVCPNCGEDDYQMRGHAFTATGKYQRYQCNACGSWFRNNGNQMPKQRERLIAL